MVSSTASTLPPVLGGSLSAGTNCSDGASRTKRSRQTLLSEVLKTFLTISERTESAAPEHLLRLVAAGLDLLQCLVDVRHACIEPLAIGAQDLYLLEVAHPPVKVGQRLDAERGHTLGIVGAGIGQAHGLAERLIDALKAAGGLSDDVLNSGLDFGQNRNRKFGATPRMNQCLPRGGCNGHQPPALARGRCEVLKLPGKVRHVRLAHRVFGEVFGGELAVASAQEFALGSGQTIAFFCRSVASACKRPASLVSDAILVATCAGAARHPGREIAMQTGQVSPLI